MTSHIAPADVSDQIVAEPSFMNLSTGQTVHTAIPATTSTEHTVIIRVHDAFRLVDDHRV